MHFIINAVGSAGDINPLLVIASSLVERGHDVDFVASAFFEDKVRRLGLNFLPVGTVQDYHEALSDPDVWRLERAFRAVWKVVMKATEPAYRLIEAHARKDETVLVGTSIAIAARLAREKLQIPLATVHLSPALFLSAYATPQSATNPLPDWCPPELKALWLRFFETMILDPVSMPALNSFRQELGLPAVSRVITKWLHSPDLVVCAFPDWFASVQADWPPRTFTTGFPIYGSAFDEELPARLEEFLAAGEPPMLVTAGTAMAFAGPFLSMGLEAAKKLGLRCLLLCAYESELPRDLPDSALAVKYANFHTLFPRVRFVVHHGGIGTSATAIAAGCPQLISPFAHDQFDNAMRIERLGLGRMIRRSDRLSDWLGAIEQLLASDADKKAGEYSARIKAEEEASLKISRLLESLR